jgi:MFS family permease
VAPALVREWGLGPTGAAWLTIAVQAGFVTGTFLYAVLNLSDVFNPRQVFFASALCGAACNGAFALLAGGLRSAVVLRFLTGVTLAGVYPVGMKIVASWFRTGLGWRLGLMVGALNVGTASPYLLLAVGAALPWRWVAATASLLAAVGGGLVLVALEDGPHLAGRARFDAGMMLKVFAHPPFRLTAFGYFGHMWELYAFWSLVSFYLAARFAGEPTWSTRLPLVSFLVLSAGALGCAGGGWISRRVGERRVALVSLLASATLCAGSGLAFGLPPKALLAYLLAWGVVVVSDSPQFSALAARNCPPEYTGTALTVQNGIGFAITVVSIQLTAALAPRVGWRWAFLFLTAGPLLGALSMWRLGGVSAPARPASPAPAPPPAPGPPGSPPLPAR